jgi:hypothetical protein
MQETAGLRVGAWDFEVKKRAQSLSWPRWFAATNAWPHLDDIARRLGNLAWKGDVDLEMIQTDLANILSAPALCRS